MGSHDPGCPCGHPLHRDVNSLEPLSSETPPDLGSLATPKRQEVLAPDIQPVERCPECNMPTPTHADECPVLDRPMFPAPKLDANLRRGHAKPTGQLLTPQEEANQRTKAKRRQRKRAKKRQQAEIAQLKFDLRRVLRAAASAMERCEVATDPSGAADEASDILAQVVTLSGELVCEHLGCRRIRPNPPCKQVDTTPGGTWVYACGHLIGK